MSIVAMKKLRLIGVQSQQKAIVKELMLLGCVQIDEPQKTAETDKLALRSGSLGEAAHDHQIQAKLINALRVLDEYAPAKRGLLSPLPEVSLDKLLDESVIPEDIKKADVILALETRVNSLNQEESRIHTSIEAIEPWKALEQPLDKLNTKRCIVNMGTLPAAMKMTDAAAVLAEAVPEAEIVEISADKVLRFCLLISLREKADEAMIAARTVGWSGINLSGYAGTVMDNLSDMSGRLRGIEKEREEVIGLIASHSEDRANIQLGVETLKTRIDRETCEGNILHTEKAFTFSGWVTAESEKLLEEKLADYCCTWETAEPDPENVEEVPVLLKNNAFTSPFNMVTEMYSRPAYNGLDPNPFIAPFFALFFGMMFADMAYGLVLLVAGLLVTLKAKPKGAMKRFAGLMIICGISTTVIGFFTGGFFGDAVTQIGKWFGQNWAIVPHLFTIHLGDIAIDMPLDLLSGNNPLYVLVLAVCLGAVHLALGVGLGMYLKIKDGQYADALLNDLCWWVIIAGIGLKLLGKTPIVLYVGLGMLVLGSFLTNKGIGKITGLFGAIYNGATGYLGDFLSYSRLMALMLAGSVIASVFNQLGSLGNKNGMTVVGTILFVVVFLIGHALNFGLNLIGCFVHTLRLQFLEFFGKWYRDGGKAFKPLNVDTKYFNVKEN